MKKLVTKTEEVEVVLCHDCGKEMEKEWRSDKYVLCSGCGELVCYDCLKAKGGQRAQLPWSDTTRVFCAACVAKNPPIVQLIKRLHKTTAALDKRREDLRNRIDVLYEALDPEDWCCYHRIKASNNASRKDTKKMGVLPVRRPCGLFSGSRFCVLGQVGRGKGLDDVATPKCRECLDYLELATRPPEDGYDE